MNRFLCQNLQSISRHNTYRCRNRNLHPYSFSRFLSTLFHRLPQRALIQVKGADSAAFLQGLITNDISHLEATGAGVKPHCIYSLMLNPSGRILYDIFIYSQYQRPGTFLLECDAGVLSEVCKHLKTFIIRKKVEIGEVDSSKATVWAVFPNPMGVCREELDQSGTQKFQLDDLKLENESDHLIAAPDPRLRALGYRMILYNNMTPVNALHGSERVHPADDEDVYRSLRYRLGVAEGIRELKPGASFPLDSNGDYLHGVSFQKGCYIGQELTARTHHTLVVRKRILPLAFQPGVELKVQYGNTIVDENGKKLGKCIACFRGHGLGLLNITESLQQEDKILFVQDDSQSLPVTTFKPYWWPIEVKDR